MNSYRTRVTFHPGNTLLVKFYQNDQNRIHRRRQNILGNDFKVTSIPVAMEVAATLPKVMLPVIPATQPTTARVTALLVIALSYS